LVSKVYYLNTDKYPAIANDYQQVKERVERKQDTKSTPEPITCVFEALPPVRRLSSFSDKINNGNITSAMGLAGLALINLPEDINDIKGAIAQFKGAAPMYDYTKLQHPFSFFRGTLLKDFVNPNKAKNPELARKILNSDKTIAQTNFGRNILKILNVKCVDKVETNIKNIDFTEANQKYVIANIYDGGKFGKLTARAMERTTKWGVIALALLQVPIIIKGFCKGGNVSKKADSGINQIIKSGIDVASITAGIGYMGALGSKIGGSAGSLIGMGAGAVIGSIGSKKLQELIF